ncbi:MAG: DEAD/DEAH box helicase, partial [Phycisphaeraceae bacterium]|nr:DEAD/DEAH box helicase [Phycisphaeraceae bacterium]
IDKLKKKPHVVVGSPGRIRELIAMGKLKTPAVRALVIDEADRLLGGDSLDSIRTIIKALPRERQLVLASATEEPASARELESLAPGIVMLRTGGGQVNPDITHFYLVCEARDKPDALRKLLHAVNPARAIVFVHRDMGAEIVAAKLAHHGVPVADLHGAFDKSERKAAMDGIRSGRIRVLIASDVAARGLDIPGVTHIVNLDVHTESKAYLHRVGRTARAGAAGCAISLMTVPELRLVRRYESELNIQMTEVHLHEGRLEPGSRPHG